MISLVDFVKDNLGIPNCQRSGGRFKKAAIGKGGFAGGNIIPIEIQSPAPPFLQPSLSQHRFPHLPRPSEENHMSAGQSFIKGVLFDRSGNINL
jgi:hypothetical protein